MKKKGVSKLFIGYLKIFIILSIFAFVHIGCGGGGGESDDPEPAGNGDNNKPVANAGSDQTVLLGSLVSLDGSGSSDADGDKLFYTWKIETKPDGSTADFQYNNVQKPAFTADKEGEYSIRLVVNDGETQSDPDWVTINTNVKPIADAGSDRTVIVDHSVTLDGTGSRDNDGDSLTYKWTIQTQPAGSDPIIKNDSDKNPDFTADIEGEYSISLVVNDGTVASDPSTVSVTLEPPVGLAFMETDTIENIAYTAYAGIGYMTEGGEGDNEFLYNVMVNDLNYLAIEMFYPTIFEDPDMLPKLIDFAMKRFLPIMKPITVTFEHEIKDQTDEVIATSTLVLERDWHIKSGVWKDFAPFRGTLTVNFRSTGFTSALLIGKTFFGENNKNDFTVSTSGYFEPIAVSDVDLSDLQGLLDSVIFLVRPLKITAKNSLSASYDEKIIDYDNWEVSYTLKYGSEDPEFPDEDPVNTQMVPLYMGITPEDIDNRDYQLHGGFSITRDGDGEDPQKYQMGQMDQMVGMHYTQTIDEEIMLTIDGELKVPEMPEGRFEEVSTSAAGASDTIIRNIGGLWTSGKMTLGDAETCEVTYSIDEDVTNALFDPSFEVDSWSVTDWEDELDPFPFPVPAP